jgi:hypothetical protein
MRAGPRTIKWATRLAQRVDPAEADRITRRMLDTIDEVSANRWEAATRRATDLPGSIRPEKLKSLSDSFARELGAAGAAAGAAAASPLVGTAATMLATTAELVWFTGRAGDLILTIAALHGRPEPTVDERRAWVLAVLIYGGSARDGFARAVNEATTGVAVHQPERRIPLATLQTANRLMSRTLLRRYGARRGAVALGTAIPLGVGAVFGASANYLAIRSLATHADQFFARLPYSAIDVESIDVTGRELPRPSPRWAAGSV